MPDAASAHAAEEACWRLTCLITPGDDMPVFDVQMAADGPGRFFADHPAVYRLSLAGSIGASVHALMRAGSPRGDRRPLWAAIAVLEAGITVGIIRARNSAVIAAELGYVGQAPTGAAGLPGEFWLQRFQASRSGAV